MAFTKASDNKLLIYSTNSSGTTRGYYVMTSAWSVSTGVWYHLAFVRTGASAKIFIDGVSQTLTENTAFGTNDVGNLATPLIIGAYSDNSLYLNGYIDELRISKGIARWTSNFTPSTEPYTTDSYTKLLLHFDGTNGSTTFIDDGGAGNSYDGTDTAISYDTSYGKVVSGASFNGSTSYINFGNTTAQKPTDALTVHSWIYPNNFDNYMAIVSMGGSYSSGGTEGLTGFHIRTTNTGQLQAFSEPEENLATGGTLTANDWNLISVTYDKSYIKAYVNGIIIASASQATSLTYYAASPVVVGTYFYNLVPNAQYFYGYIDETIIENVAWTSTQVLAYYNESK